MCLKDIGLCAQTYINTTLDSIVNIITIVRVSVITYFERESSLWPLKVIWVLFGSFCFFLQLLPIRSKQQNLYYISKSMMKHQQNPDWKSDQSWFSYDDKKWMCFDSLIAYLGPPVVLTIGSRMIDKFWARSQPLQNTCLVGFLSCILPNHTQTQVPD